MGLSPTQEVLLHYLLTHCQQDIYGTDLQAVLGISKSSVSAALKALRQNGYLTLQDDPRDDRKKQIILTGKAYGAEQAIREGLKLQQREAVPGDSGTASEAAGAGSGNNARQSQTENGGIFMIKTLLAPVFTAGEVLMEVLIPFVTASIIDKEIEAGDIGQVYYYGGIMLAIARAAVADPPVLILDEATSSIDTRTEKLVQEGMDALMTGRTTFVIAHRLSTVRNSDCIIVLEQGRIIERGTHEQLIGEKGRYYQLYTGNAIRT